MDKRRVAIVIGCLSLVAAEHPACTEAGGPAFRVLVFSKTTGFRHASIANGIAAIQMLGDEGGFAVDASEDDRLFTDAGLRGYDVVVFLSTTGNILDADEKAAFQRYIEAGGGFVGIHSATDTEYDWPFYGDLVGAYFRSHPSIQQATINVVDPMHPSTLTLPAQWVRTDEWYNFRTNPRDRVHVLLQMDESTYSGGEMGVDHPIAWCHDFAGGRAWYTALGHTEQSYTEPLFLDHLLGGLRTAAGVDLADCAVP